MSVGARANRDVQAVSPRVT